MYPIFKYIVRVSQNEWVSHSARLLVLIFQLYDIFSICECDYVTHKYLERMKWYYENFVHCKNSSIIQLWTKKDPHILNSNGGIKCGIVLAADESGFSIRKSSTAATMNKLIPQIATIFFGIIIRFIVMPTRRIRWFRMNVLEFNHSQYHHHWRYKEKYNTLFSCTLIIIFK